MAKQTAIQKANNPSENEKFYQWFVKSGFAKPGMHITMNKIRKFLKINIPECMKPIDCQRLSLQMLGPIGYTRDKLLHKGLYFGQKHGNFVVQDLKDTSLFILAYALKARNSMIRGKTLNNNLAKKYNKHKKANDDAFTDAINEIIKVQS